MRPGYLIFGLLIILNSCNKDENKYEYEYDPVVKYVIELEGLHINSYTKYIENELIQTTTFVDYDTAIVKITKVAAEELEYIIRYSIGQNNYATSSSVSIGDSGSYISRSTYEYEDDFRSKRTTEDLNNPDSTISEILYEIEDDNIVSINTSVEGSSVSSNLYRYNIHQNLIDVKQFSNNITGKISKNLTESATRRVGIGNTPVHFNEFTYEFNSAGFVTKTIELITPYSTSGGSSTITCTVKTTVYEYVFR